MSSGTLISPVLVGVGSPCYGDLSISTFYYYHKEKFYQKRTAEKRERERDAADKDQDRL